MNEEIDIIELLRRVKEGIAPKEIEMLGNKFVYVENWESIDTLYERRYEGGLEFYSDYDIDFATKIKILDKPIIEELDTIVGDLENPTHNEMLLLNWIRNNRIKINELTKYINKEEK
ncbi:MAG: hypothetical protein IKE91_00490 [Clostridia bacterium]|nr:hypothetical protein [Clostridia bacterium]